MSIADMTITRHNPGARLSSAVVHGDTVYLTGEVARDESTGVKAQTEAILRQIDTLLGAVGSNKSKLLSVTIWLADIATFQEMNDAWDAWVDPQNSPARATVEAKLGNPKYVVEMMATAAV